MNRTPDDPGTLAVDCAPASCQGIQVVPCGRAVGEPGLPDADCVPTGSQGPPRPCPNVTTGYYVMLVTLHCLRRKLELKAPKTPMKNTTVNS